MNFLRNRRGCPATSRGAARVHDKGGPDHSTVVLVRSWSCSCCAHENGDDRRRGAGKSYITYGGDQCSNYEKDWRGV